jgi:hypothetical protein
MKNIILINVCNIFWKHFAIWLSFNEVQETKISSTIQSEIFNVITFSANRHLQ